MMLKHIPIRDGGFLLHNPQFFAPAEADALFSMLREQTPWAQEVSRGRPFPRLTAWYADPGLTYHYTGVTHHATPWTPALLAVKARVEAAAETTWNSLLLNRYRDGRDSIGLHTDAEPELGLNPVIGSVSLGASRRFILKHIETGERMEFDLGPGSLLVMGGTSQHHWRHGVPKTAKPVGERINLTFRRIL